MHPEPITLLEPLVVLIARHKGYVCENISNEKGERCWARQENWVGLVWSAGVAFGQWFTYLNRMKILSPNPDENLPRQYKLPTATTAL